MTIQRATRIVIVDDHTIVRSGLRMLIESQPDMRIVGEAADGASALDTAACEQPDIILLDLDLHGKSALDILPDLRGRSHARVIILTGLRDPEAHRAAVRLGAMGLVLKDQAADLIVKAIQHVRIGEVWIDPALVATVLSELSRGGQARPVDPEALKIATLTDRERQVIGLICEGLPNKQIAQRLTISEITVRHHLTSIFDKLGVANRLELVIYAYRHNLANPPS